MKYLLDTNIISEIREHARADPNVARWVARTAVEEIGTSVRCSPKSVVELKRRGDPEQAIFHERWFSQMRTKLGDRVLPINELIPEVWALLSIPNPLPLIDGLLAATAKVHGLTLVTRNVAHIAPASVSFLNPFSA